MKSLNEEKKGWFKDSWGNIRWGKISAVVLTPIIIILLLLIAMLATVNVGEAALLVDPISNSVSSTPILGPSWFLRAPWISVVKVYYAVDTLGMWGKNFS